MYFFVYIFLKCDIEYFAVKLQTNQLLQISQVLSIFTHEIDYNISLTNLQMSTVISMLEVFVMVALQVYMPVANLRV